MSKNEFPRYDAAARARIARGTVLGPMGLHDPSTWRTLEAQATKTDELYSRLQGFRRGTTGLFFKSLFDRAAKARLKIQMKCRANLHGKLIDSLIKEDDARIDMLNAIYGRGPWKDTGRFVFDPLDVEQRQQLANSGKLADAQRQDEQAVRARFSVMRDAYQHSNLWLLLNARTFLHRPGKGSEELPPVLDAAPHLG